jgi:hypothetical protein
VLAAAPAAPPAVPAGPAATADPVALDKKLLAEAKNGSEIMSNLTHLSDVIGARLTGSSALKRANEWAADTMRRYGLTDVHLEAWTIPLGWERGTATMRIIEPDNGKLLTVAAMGWTPGTKGKITGNVVIMDVKDSAGLAAYKGKLKGAIVLRGAPTPIRPVTETGLFDQPRRPRDRDTTTPTPAPKPDAKPGTKPETAPERRQPPEGAFQRMMAFRKELTEFLRTEGAAVLVMDAGKPHGLLNMTGAWQGNDRVSGADPLPAVFMTHEHYALLHRLANRPSPAHTRVEVEIDNKLIPGPVVVYNTIGEIRGSEKPDELVILGAHLDSWDLGQGTTDNGTGTSVVLEAARILSRSGIKPKRTIRFVLFTGEEQGLHGSKAYVEKHKGEMDRTSLALVHDTGTGKVLGIGLQGRTAIQPILEKELTSLKEVGMTDINLRGMGGSDHMSFERVGVPGFAVQQDWAEYRFSHHSQSDTLDKAHESDLIQGAQVLAVTALRVANLPKLLPRDKPPQETTTRPSTGSATEKPAVTKPDK